MKPKRKHSGTILPWLVLSLSLLGFGCGKDLDVAAFGKIEKGMTQEQVLGLLGEGSEVAAADVKSIVGNFEEMNLQETDCDKWMKWGNRKATGYVGFQDGKVRELILD